MPKKKTVVPDEQPVEGLAAAETGGEENTALFPEAAPSEEGENIPAGEETLFNSPPPDSPAGEEPPSDVPYGDIPDAEALPAEDGAPAAGEPPADLPPDSPPQEELPSGGDFPLGEENPFPDVGDTALFPQPQEDMEPESDDPEYGALDRKSVV